MSEDTLPENYEDLPVELQKELEEAFTVYFGEMCTHTYLMGLYNYDEVSFLEIVEENDKFIRDFLSDKLMDEH